MERDEIFEAWAPAGGAWSPWVKPVLFAFLPRPLPQPFTEPPFPAGGAPTAADRQALVLELPGPRAVTVGLALAERGYRPVPVFNACPPPWDELTQSFAPAAVDADATLAELAAGAERLRTLVLSPDAPPAFLVDANRQTPRIPFAPGVFDNRSVVFPTDFPSAGFLASRGITGVVLIRDRQGPIAWDLAAVLRGWRRGGLALRTWRSDRPELPPAPLELSWLGIVGEWLGGLWAGLNLRPNPAGGYGALLTEASGG